MTDSLIWRSIAHRRKLFLVYIAVGLAVLPVLLTIFRPSFSGIAHIVLVSENTQRDPLVKSKDVPVLANSAEVLSRVKQIDGLDDPLKSIRKHLSVKSNSEASNMLSVTFKAHDPDMAAKVANTVAEQTIQYYHRLSAQQYDRLIGYLRGQIVTQRGTIATLDHQVQRAAQADTFVSTDKAVDTITERLDELQGKLGDAMAALTADQAAARAAGQQPKEVAGIMRDQQLASDPLFQNLLTAQARDAAQLGSIQSHYNANYPGLRSLREQVRLETALLNTQKATSLSGGFSSSPVYAQTVLAHRQSQALVAGDQARVDQYNSQIIEEQRRLADLGNTGVSVAVLRTERDAAMTTYQALATQLSTVLANQAEASSLGSLVLVDRATDASALLETLVSRVIVGVIVVFAIALMIAVAVEILDPRLRTSSDIERLYGRPVIATD